MRTSSVTCSKPPKGCAGSRRSSDMRRSCGSSIMRRERSSPASFRTDMKLAINLLLSVGMLVLCVWLIWPDHATRTELANVFHRMNFRTFAPYLAAYLGLLVIVQLTRSLRWNYLLAPLGVRIPPAPLLAISSVGFMAILALPVRLGEFVRPGLMRKRGISASAALGTVAVE